MNRRLSAARRDLRQAAGVTPACPAPSAGRAFHEQSTGAAGFIPSCSIASLLFNEHLTEEGKLCRTPLSSP